MGQRVAAVLRLNVGQHPRGGLAHLTVRVPGLRAVRVRLFLLALTAAQARSRHGVRLIIVSRRSGRPECPDLWRPDRPGRPLPAIRNDGSGVGLYRPFRAKVAPDCSAASPRHRCWTRHGARALSPSTKNGSPVGTRRHEALRPRSIDRRGFARGAGQWAAGGSEAMGRLVLRLPRDLRAWGALLALSGALCQRPI